MLLYLFQLGDNPLEELFSVIRTATHQRNFDVLQFRDNIAVAAQITAALDNNEAWKKQHSKTSVRDDRDRPYAVKGEHPHEIVMCVPCMSKACKSHQCNVRTEMSSDHAILPTDLSKRSAQSAQQRQRFLIIPQHSHAIYSAIEC